VSFGGLTDKTIKGLTSLLSVKQKIQYILHTLDDCIMRSVSKVQQECKLDGIPHSVEMKIKLCIVMLKDYKKQSSLNKKITMQMELMKWLLCCGISHVKASIFGK
jgi:predicted DNA-binding protein YlxM (UPF0122 family)